MRTLSNIKIRLKLYQWAGLFLLLVLSTVVLASQGASKSAICKGSHTRKDFYKSVRLLEPANILEITDNRVNYATTVDGVELGSLELENEWSAVPKDFHAKHKGCYEIFYCETHKVILVVNELPANQCHLNKS